MLCMWKIGNDTSDIHVKKVNMVIIMSDTDSKKRDKNKKKQEKQ